jgi:DNA/RNA-binding domain of Phe-tRNA-synthetase-like protein
MNPELIFDDSLAPSPAHVALIWADGIADPCARSGMPDFLSSVVAEAHRQGEALWGPETRKQVRDMLRHGRYKPSGRSKPASEFLLRAAQEEQFPSVCCPVDVNNAISLSCGLPGSIFDADLSGENLLLRRGRPGERYVFNSAGQEIELEDLLLVCRKQDDDWQPCGNPVKDAMATKVRAGTRRLIAVLYAPRAWTRQQVAPWADRFVELLREACSARQAEWIYHPAGGPPPVDSVAPAVVAR